MLRGEECCCVVIARTTLPDIAKLAQLQLVPCVTFDRKIKRSDLNVVIVVPDSPRIFLCSSLVFHVSPKLCYRFRTGRRSGAASYCEPANSTKSQRIDLGIYPDKANISYSRCDS